MTNKDVVILANTGALDATAHDLPAAEAYKLIIFKRAARRQLEEIRNRQEEIGDDPRKEELIAELMKEEVKLDCRTMSFEAYHALAKENRAIAVCDPAGRFIGDFDPFSLCEEALEGVLWRAPEE